MFAMRRGRRVSLSVVGLTAAVLGVALSGTAVSEHHAQRFETAADACDHVADRINGGDFLCLVEPPSRVTSSDTSYWVEPAGELWRRYRILWRPAEGRGRLYFERESKGFLKRKTRSLRRDGVRTRSVRVRGRPAIFACFDREASATYRWPLCSLGWKELGNSYFALGFQRGVSRPRLRRDLRAVARAATTLQPASEST